MGGNNSLSLPAAVFMTVLGLLVSDRFLMTGKLHLPVPAPAGTMF